MATSSEGIYINIHYPACTECGDGQKEQTAENGDQEFHFVFLCLPH
jgi:hypothetical protein